MATPTQPRAEADSEESTGVSHPDSSDGSRSSRHEQEGAEPPKRARRLASGGVIREAAAQLFLERGYQGTSMDDIAAAAHISKQTIYTHFADKKALFSDLVLGNVDRVDAFVADLPATVYEAQDVETGLREVARRYLRIVIRPEVLRLRRLVIGEAGRFPELAQTYYERVPQRVYSALAAVIQELSVQGRLQAIDPVLASHHLAWLILGMPMDRGMFYGPDETMTEAELGRIAGAAVQVFMAAYGAAQASPHA